METYQGKKKSGEDSIYGVYGPLYNRYIGLYMDGVWTAYRLLAYSVYRLPGYTVYASFDMFCYVKHILW